MHSSYSFPSSHPGVIPIPPPAIEPGQIFFRNDDKENDNIENILGSCGKLSFEEPMGIQTASSVTIDDLPDELLCRVFSFFSHKVLVTQVAKVCRRWHILVDAQPMWQKLNLGDKTLSYVQLSSICSRLVKVLRLYQTIVSDDGTPLDSCGISPFDIELLDCTCSSFANSTMFANFLQKCKSLRCGSFEGCDFSGIYLPHFQQLTILNLTMAKRVRADSLNVLFKYNHNVLTEVSIAWTEFVYDNFNVDDLFLLGDGILTASDRTLRQHSNAFNGSEKVFTKLTRLNIAGHQEFRDSTISRILTTCPMLVEFDMSDCRELTCAALESICSSPHMIHRLEALHMSRCLAIHDRFLLVACLEKLRVFTMFTSIFASHFDEELILIQSHRPALAINRNDHIFSTIARPTPKDRVTGIWNVSFR